MLLRWVNIAVIILILATVLSNGVGDCRVRIQVALIEDIEAVFYCLKLVISFYNSSLLADMDLSRALLYFLKTFVLSVELLLFEVGDACRCSVFKLRCIVHNSTQPLPIVFQELLEIAIVSYKLSGLLHTIFTLVFVHRNIFIAYSSTISCHLQLVFYLVHDIFEACEELHIQQLLLEFFE